MILFSIFTPVYNRKNKIYRVYESLINQTVKNFEWIVIDDGSTDNVLELLIKMKENAKFPIIIISQKHQGKHIAWNKAVSLARGELFVPADADDEFAPSTLEVFSSIWLNLDKYKKKKIAGINVLCLDAESGNIIGDKFPEPYLEAHNLDIFFKYKIRGEKWGCMRTDLLRQRLFPEMVGDFFPESFIWFHFRDYNWICVNIPLRKYFKEQDSISAKKNIKYKLKRAPALFYYQKWYLTEIKDYIVKYENFFEIIKEYLKLCLYAIYLKKDIGYLLCQFQTLIEKIIILILYPFALIYFCLEKN